LSSSELASFQEWLNQSPQHGAEIERIAVLWENLDILKALSSAGQTSRASGSLQSRRFDFVRLSPNLRYIAALGVSLLILVTVAIFQLPGGGTFPDVNRVYQTGLGEQESVTLADGSTALLNTDSRVEIAYTSQNRAVHLLKGEAHFAVAHQPERPFFVYVGSGVVRAVGTAFTVRLRESDVEVTVTEGAVELASVSDVAETEPETSVDAAAKITPTTRLALVKAGQSAVFHHDIESIQSIAEEELARKLSWQHGMLIFSGEPLETVVEEVSRYTPTKIVILDPALRDLRIGGYFRTGETDAMFEALESTFNVRVRRVGEDLVYLASARQ
jgi:transmembrane sensor